MTELFIDGVVVPYDGKIKIVRKNPRLEHSGQYSLDVTIPMDSASARQVFGHINRKDIEKTTVRLPARLIAGNRTIIRGSATITKVTDTDITVQLLGGMSDILHGSETDIYIDEMDFPNEVYEDYVQGTILTSSQAGTFMGKPGRYAFVPIFDSTAEKVKNLPYFSYDDSTDQSRWTWLNPNNRSKLAIQPNLHHVMELVLGKMGYSIAQNQLDAWTHHIYIASSRGTKRIERALPHWTVSEFIAEYESFFNCTLVVNESEGSVSITKNNVMPPVHPLEPVDEYEANIAEDDGEISGNIRFKLDNSTHHVDCLSEEIRSAFKSKTYDSLEDLMADFGSIPVSSRDKYFFVCPQGTYIYHPDYDTPSRKGLSPVNQFGALKRTETDDYKELKICPVGMVQKEFGPILKYIIGSGGQITQDTTTNLLPVVANPCGDVEGEHLRRLDRNLDDDFEDGEDDASIADILFKDSETNTGEKEDMMQVMLIDGITHYTTINDDGRTVVIPMAFNDSGFGMAYGNMNSFSSWSHGLTRGQSTYYLGQLHETGHIVDSGTEVVYQFTSRDVPEVTDIFEIWNKHYACREIEFEIDEHGVLPIMTGHFYEMQ